VNKIMAGWTAGGGFEWMFARNLSLKGEYLLYNLGDVNYGSSPSLTTFGVSNSALPWTTLKYDGQIARVGLNYYFAP
jgi:outer membrane immunogenic protein